LKLNFSISNSENISQDGKYTDLTFLTWIAFSLPTAIVNLMIILVIIGAMNLGIPDLKLPFSSVYFYRSSPKWDETEGYSEEHVRKMLGVKVKELGGITFHESVVIVLFTIAVLLWFTRDPQFVDGWSSLFAHTGVKIGDSSVGIMISILMFIIPRKVKYFGCSKRIYLELKYQCICRERILLVLFQTLCDLSGFEGSTETVMTWQYIQEHFPWNVILLVGGGLAISDGANKSGLSGWVGDQLYELGSLSKEVNLLLLLLIISCVTEVISNSATISLVTPILISVVSKYRVQLIRVADMYFLYK
jgi:di/tricarboxylate transporter